jgi:glycosyltransferase involved in cell wall biosynthesis
MRITFLSPTFNLTGGHRVKAIYAQKLHERGHEVTVVASGPRKPSLRQIARSLVRDRAWPRSSAGMPSHFDRVDAECRVLDHPGPITDADVPDADVVVATWWETAEWAALLSPSKGVKVYFIQHHEVWSYLPLERVEATWRAPMQKIVVAGWLAEIARERYGDDGAVLVPNAVDRDQFHAPPRGKNTVPTVGLMYSSGRFKGCDVSLEAFRIAAGRIPGLRLVAFGSEEVDRDRLPLPEGAEFHFRPAQDDLRRHYASCDAWLFGSRDEGFGLPILEAMACRTPVIGTPVGAAPELIGQGGGYLVRPEDPEDMAAAIERIVALPDDRWQAMSDIAHETANRYTWDDAADLFETALIQAVERSKVAVF